MALRRYQHAEGPDYEILKIREAHHIGLEFDTGVANQALAIINEGVDHERQYYDLLALARRHAEPLETWECEPVHADIRIGRMRRAMRRLDGVIVHASQELVGVPTETISAVSFIGLGSVAVASSEILAKNPVALTGYIVTAFMVTSFILQLHKQERML